MITVAQLLREHVSLHIAGDIGHLGAHAALRAVPEPDASGAGCKTCSNNGAFLPDQDGWAPLRKGRAGILTNRDGDPNGCML